MTNTNIGEKQLPAAGDHWPGEQHEKIMQVSILLSVLRES